MFYGLAIILHLLAINIWVGGTFFTVVILPRATAIMTPDERHVFMSKIFKQFFFWVWLALVLLLSTGGLMTYQAFGGLIQAPVYVVLMMGTALLMMCVFLIIFFGPYHSYLQSISNEDWSQCEKHFGHIRLLSKINMVFGICIVMVIGVGPHLLT